MHKCGLPVPGDKPGVKTWLYIILDYTLNEKKPYTLRKLKGIKAPDKYAFYDNFELLLLFYFLATFAYFPSTKTYGV